MAEPQLGDSRKKSLAITTVTGILAYHPKTWIEISAALIVAVIAIYAIWRQSKLDEKKEFDKAL